MSTSTHQTRSRTRAQRGDTEAAPLVTNSGAQAQPAYVAEGAEFPVIVDAVPRSYRDALLSRSPSPQSGEVNSVRVIATPHNNTTQEREGSYENISQDNSKELEDGNPNPWITVNRKRARSLDSNMPIEINSLQFELERANSKLTAEQIAAVEAAQQSLTSEQEAQVLRRNKNMATVPDPSDSQSLTSDQSRIPLERKGKGPDPGNWGGINLPEGEGDPLAQQAAIESYSSAKNVSRHTGLPKTGTDHTTAEFSGRHVSPRERHSETRPVDQIVAQSYLGKALQDASRESAPIKRESSAPGGGGGDEPPSGDGDSNGDESSENSSGDSDSEKEVSKKKSRKSKKHRRTRLKPIPPKVYNGAADARAYHRFVREGMAYVKDGHVKPKRRAFNLSYFLTGKAYDFYTQKVSMNDSEWALDKFFTELFNYCFPVNYRGQMRERLKKCYQNDKSVSEFVHELEELYIMIGTVDERERVNKLWFGLRKNIQATLWRDRLNPEVSSWDEVRGGAEMVELSEQATGPVRREKDRPDVIHRSSTMAERSRRPQRPYNRGGREINAIGSLQTSKVKTNGSTNSRLGFSPRGNSGPSRQRGAGGRSQARVPRGKFRELSQKEHAEFAAAGKCFNCGETGHIARNCPEHSVVKSGGTRPPGISNFSVGIETLPDDDGEVLDSLPFCAIEWIDESDIILLNDAVFDSFRAESRDKILRTCLEEPSSSDWMSSYIDIASVWNPPWMTRDSSRAPRNHIGDTLVMMAEYLLEIGQPYPGDHLWSHPLPMGSRFRLVKTSLDIYVIQDKRQIRDTPVTADQLGSPTFAIGEWYSRQRALSLGCGLLSHHENSWPMDDSYSCVAQELLSDGITLYPSISMDFDDEIRFNVQEYTEGIHCINDYDIGKYTLLPTGFLTNPRFDLVNWYGLVLRGERGLGNLPTPFPEGWRRPCQLMSVEQSESDMDSDDSYDSDSNYEFAVWSETDPAPLDSLFEMGEDDSEIGEYITIVSDTDSDSEWGLTSERMSVGLIGDLRRSAIVESLHRGAPYPGDGDEALATMFGRFTVQRQMRVTSNGINEIPDIYEIDDTYRDIQVHLHRAQLDGPIFTVHEWYRAILRPSGPEPVLFRPRRRMDYLTTEHIIEKGVERLLRRGAPYAEDGAVGWSSVFRFTVAADPGDANYYLVTDLHRGCVEHLPAAVLENTRFDVVGWYEWRCCVQASGNLDVDSNIMLHGVQVARGTYPGLQRNAAMPRVPNRLVPKPLVVTVRVNGHPVRALLDTGSLGDFISSTLVDQLKLKREVLSSPLSLQLAVQGSRSKITAQASAKLEYQTVSEKRTFDIINISNYDVILGTPWLYQHQASLGLNPARVVIGSNEALPVVGGSSTRAVVHALTTGEDDISAVRERLVTLAERLCKEVEETPLPPLRAINHRIPLIDETKIYPWRPSKCPEVFREQWAVKRDAYLKTGRWEVTSAGNTVPMLLIPKPHKSKPELRTVIDLRERNKNTVKQTSPLPDMDGILRRLAQRRFRTSLDMKSAYEQIRIVPEDVPRSAVTTPDGNMLSNVIQIGDCNALATYQALMNHLFSAYIGCFMDIYLDDIVIYSDTLEDHEGHVKIVLDILEREKLYLSRGKLHFLARELSILGRVVDDEGIRMDAEKVDSVVRWKTPTNRDLLRGFIGSVGYLADDVPGVRIPLGVLSGLTGDTVPFRWGFTEQRAFEDAKALVESARGHHRVPLSYVEGASPIWMVTDGCATGLAGVVSQGEAWQTARVAAFYSAKLNSAQRNYPVHEIEMLAGVETMLRHQDILQGIPFTWVTDHKGLIHLLNQKNLSGRQARWLEKISSFNFKVEYIPGAENVLADALSRLYSNDAPGTVRARSEYTYHDVVDEDGMGVSSNMPILTGMEAMALGNTSRGREPLAPAESGRPETSKEFARRVRSTFVLRGPREQTEGKSMGVSRNASNKDRNASDDTSTDTSTDDKVDNESTKNDQLSDNNKAQQRETADLDALNRDSENGMHLSLAG